ncbi:helix-turn-helix domain-containing protein [Bradyrhizobium zhanjiangense]|uniref:DNA-binding protein n=1 Tax=Bradyrhizobium zhanjiangense TaxID=1325107 RepID=A0A4Q0Q5F8_9BRAD|nr:helix-turn-helix domain-containing protein [Bradyrhizobium zhanjiangense]RXG83813.1 DNA-binding protein [Bradyrhizobium zhanjiangense]
MKLAYSIVEACDLLSIGRTTLYQLIKAGDLQTRKVGRRTLIPAKSLDSFIGAVEQRDGRACGDGSADVSHDS